MKLILNRFPNFLRVHVTITSYLYGNDAAFILREAATFSSAHGILTGTPLRSCGHGFPPTAIPQYHRAIGRGSCFQFVKSATPVERNKAHGDKTRHACTKENYCWHFYKYRIRH